MTGASRWSRSPCSAGQLSLHAAARPEIGEVDWIAAAGRLVTEIRVHAFGNALGLLLTVDGHEAPLILPDQVALLLRDSLVLAATCRMDRTHPAPSRSER